MKGAPAGRMIEFAPLIERQVIVVVDVRRESALVLADDDGEFLADRLRRGFELGEPRKLLALVEFDRRQAGVEILERLLLVALAGPQGRADEGVDAFALHRQSLARGGRNR